MQMAFFWIITRVIRYDWKIEVHPFKFAKWLVLFKEITNSWTLTNLYKKWPKINLYCHSLPKYCIRGPSCPYISGFFQNDYIHGRIVLLRKNTSWESPVTLFSRMICFAKKLQQGAWVSHRNLRELKTSLHAFLFSPF